MTCKPAGAFTVALALLISACTAGNTTESIGTETPVFATATIPAAPIPSPTQTALPPTPVPTVAPVEAVTTTQVNVRAAPSTGSPVLGTILQPSRVEVSGKDATGTWYQLLYPSSPQGRGWVLAQYVQIVAQTEVPAVPVGSDPSVVASVVVLQLVHVRSGPGTQHESLGTLSPNDVVALTGKDPSGAWLQIEFTNAPDGKGWVNTDFVQAGGLESVPVVDEIEEPVSTEAPPGTAAITSEAVVLAPQDGDSAEAPSTSVTFSPTASGALQHSGEVSAPQGDHEDWIQFTPYSPRVVIQLTCSGSANLQLELWQHGAPMTGNEIGCEERRIVVVQSNQSYLAHVRATSENDLALVKYVLKIEQLSP